MFSLSKVQLFTWTQQLAPTVTQITKEESAEVKQFLFLRKSYSFSSVTPCCSPSLRMSLEKKDKRKHFGLFVTSSPIDIDRQMLSTFEPKRDKTNKITVCLAKPTQISLGIILC